MGIWDALRGELIDIIEWNEQDPDQMVWRFPRYENEIKNGAKLIVRESQVAAFVNEGVLADLFLWPGTFTLETRNLPVLSTLRGWKYGFDSPFKAEVYFVSTRTFTDRKWGTKNPIMLRDPEFGVVRLRAFGTFAIKVTQPATLLKEVVGTHGHFSIDQINDQLRNMLVSRFTDVLAESKIPALDLASNYDELGKFVADRIKDDFERFGLSVVSLLVENISLPPEVEKVMDQRTSMGIVGNLQAYTQFQAANAIGKAAENPSGLAGGGVGMGLGMAMGRQIAESMGQPGAVGGAAAGAGGPPPLPGPTGPAYYAAVDGKQAGPFDVGRLQQMVSEGRVTRQTLVWKQGMGNWTEAGQVAELGNLFAALPPPLPPPQS